MYCVRWGTRWRSWLRHYATSRKVAVSIPDGVSGIFQSLNPSGRTTAVGSTQPLTEMSTRNPSWGKDGRCVGLTNLPLSCADCLEILEPQPPGTSRASPGLYRESFTFTVSGKFQRYILPSPVVSSVRRCCIIIRDIHTNTTCTDLLYSFTHSLIHFILYLTTSPQPPPKRVLRRVRSSASL
jgi:hypothetical protein